MNSSLTWTLSDREAPARSWSDIQPVATASTPVGRPEAFDDPTTPMGAVYAALRAGFAARSEIMLATGLSLNVVDFRLRKLQRAGLATCSSRGRFARWRLCL